MVVAGLLVVEAAVQLSLCPTLQHPLEHQLLPLVVEDKDTITQVVCQVIWVGNVEEILLHLDM